MADEKTGSGNGGMGGGYLPAPVHETAVAAAASQAKAQVEARYLMALQRPRDMDDVRVRILNECKRPRFAEAAIYAKPVGGTRIEGPSIRFAEAALRCLGNVDVQTPTLYEDDEKRIVRVMVTELEANTTYSSDITIQKTVERRKVREGQQVLGTRTNTKGDTVYIVRATEDELLNKTLAAVSKAIRNNGLRILPGDILEEAMELCERTRRDRDAKDPEEARKRIVDAFAGLGVKPADLAAYLGHDVASCSPAELDDLRKVFAAVKDGETTWAEVLRVRQESDAKKRAADRDKDTLDAKDVKKVRAEAGKVAEGHDGVDGDVVLADVLFLDDVGQVESFLPSVPKADLPKVLRDIKAWQPTQGREGSQDKGAQQELGG